MKNICVTIALIFLVTGTAGISVAQEVVRKTKLIRGSDYYEDVFYSGDQELARQKTANRKILEQNGEIPDGKIKFIDESEHTYGEEYYKNGRRQGPASAYYEDGQLKIESYYKDGMMISSKEYYKNGTLRFEVNYEDARDDKKGDSEVGIGKLYFSNGTLRYEWDVTKSKKVGFKKAYNQNGELVYEAYYDADGQLIPTQQRSPGNDSKKE